MIQFLEERGIDTSTWPSWLTEYLPVWTKGAVVISAVIGVWLAGWFVKRVMLYIGHRRLDEGEQFEGSAWDMGASIARLGTMLLLAPLPFQAAGLPAFDFVGTRAPSAISAALTLIVAIVFATWLARSIRKFGEKSYRRSGAGDALFSFMSSMLKYIIFAVALVVALTQLGMNTNSLVALLGAAGLAIGLALQDTLKAVAAGVMLAIFRPFRIGDWIEINGLDGEVIDITPFQTTIRQIDHKTVFITNDTVWAEALINYTRQSRRRLDLYFDVSYDDDLDHALDVLKSAASAHGRILAKDEIWVGVHALADWSVKLRLRAWVATPEFVQVRSDITKMVKQAFDANGVKIPYPHQVEIQRIENVASNSPVEGGTTPETEQGA